MLAGVIGGGFGAVEAIKRLGLERRLFTMGKYKAALDPFKCAQHPAKPSEAAASMVGWPNACLYSICTACSLTGVILAGAFLTSWTPS